MRQLQPIYGNGIAIAAVAAEQLTDGRGCASVEQWNRNQCVSEFLLELWASEPATVDIDLYSVTSHPMRFDAALELIVDGDKLVSSSAHKLRTGDGPFYAQTGKAAAQDGAPCFVQVLGAKSLRLCSSLASAFAGAGEVPAHVAVKGGATLTASGTDAPQAPSAVAPAAGLQRLCWSRIERLTGVELAPQQGMQRIMRHTPRTLAYALVATAPGAGKGVGANVVQGAIWAIRES